MQEDFFEASSKEAVPVNSAVSRAAQLRSDINRHAHAYYVLDALLAIDHHQVFLSQLQSRGLLHSCLAEISSNSYQVRHDFFFQSVFENV